MPVIQKLIDAQDNQDLKAYNEVLSEDYYWLRHSTGEKVPRDELSKWLISPDAPKTESSRIIYENDEIGVAHYFISFKDGSRQAVLVVYIIKDGKIIRSETGATNMPKKKKKGKNMSIIEKMTKIVNDGDVAAGEEMIHDDYQFLMHSSGNKLGKQDILKWLGMKDVKKEKVRVLFENDEVGFEHAYVSYNDGNKEAVMTYYKYKDGKVIYMETGATKLPK